jgi:hypothetical protein
METMIFLLEVKLMNYIDLHKLKPGDKIVVPKSWLQVVQHHVIYLGQNHSGVDLIAENAVGSHVHITAANEFFSVNTEITRIERFVGDKMERRIAIERALKQLGQPYDLINYNCEHFANYVQTGKPISTQVGWGIFAAIAVVIIVALSTD